MAANFHNIFILVTLLDLVICEQLGFIEFVTLPVQWLRKDAWQTYGARRKRLTGTVSECSFRCLQHFPSHHILLNQLKSQNETDQIIQTCRSFQVGYACMKQCPQCNLKFNCMKAYAAINYFCIDDAKEALSQFACMDKSAADVNRKCTNICGSVNMADIYLNPGRSAPKDDKTVSIRKNLSTICNVHNKKLGKTKKDLKNHLEFNSQSSHHSQLDCQVACTSPILQNNCNSSESSTFLRDLIQITSRSSAVVLRGAQPNLVYPKTCHNLARGQFLDTPRPNFKRKSNILQNKYITRIPGSTTPKSTPTQSTTSTTPKPTPMQSITSTTPKPTPIQSTKSTISTTPLKLSTSESDRKEYSVESRDVNEIMEAKPGGSDMSSASYHQDGTVKQKKREKVGEIITEFESFDSQYVRTLLLGIFPGLMLITLVAVLIKILY